MARSALDRLSSWDTDLYFFKLLFNCLLFSRNIFYFIPAVSSPGVAFLVPGIEEGASAMAIFDSVLEGKPILILTVIMALLAGIVMWMLVCIEFRLLWR